MRISKKSRYGLRMMLELALEYGNGYIFLKEIASRQDISEKYLSQIVLSLKARGLVISGRGAKGGHMLSRHPSEITVGEIVGALEGDPGIVECVVNRSFCPKRDECPAADVWENLERVISATLSATSLSDLVNKPSVRRKKNVKAG